MVGFSRELLRSGIVVKKRVLVIYYSFTQQTRILVKKFGEGIEKTGHEVYFERLRPRCAYGFPMKTNLRLVSIMIRTFLRQRQEVEPVSRSCYGPWDYVVLAGPTWSYHPSGPMLSFLDQFGDELLAQKKVIPFISCRSYWRLHLWSLRYKLKRLGATVMEPLIYKHPTREPYRFIGLCLQLRGKTLRHSWFRKNYPHYGNSKEQAVEAMEKGAEQGRKWLVDPSAG